MTLASERVFVQYGAGYCAPEGWRNFDASPTLKVERFPFVGRFVHKNENRFADRLLSGDIVKGLPVDRGTVDAVYCSHVLEHLSLEDCQRALQNTFAML